jgi:hypothetical protein
MDVSYYSALALGCRWVKNQVSNDRTFNNAALTTTAPELHIQYSINQQILVGKRFNKVFPWESFRRDILSIYSGKNNVLLIFN